MATTPSKRGALYSNMGRPYSGGALSTFGPNIKDRVYYLRKHHPGWGAKTIYTELKHDPRFSGIALPSIRSIGLFLKEQGLLKRYDKHVRMPDSKRHTALRPHHIWELDAQGGCKLEQIGPVAMINIKDVYTRTYCMAFPNKKRSIYGYSKRCDYQTALRLAFSEYGLPERIQTDHEGIFYENKSKSPFPTLLHLWLVGLGISLSFSRFNRPTDQAMVERMHQTIEKQVVKGIVHKNWAALFDFCQRRRRFMNRYFPCSSLDNRSPYQAFKKARHSGRFYYPQSENNMLDLEKIYAFLAKGNWFRRVSKAKTLTLGRQVYYLKASKPQTQLEITFDPESQMFSFHDDKRILINRQPIKGLNKEVLSGELFWKMANIQLELPLCWQAQKVSTTFLHND